MRHFRLLHLVLAAFAIALATAGEAVTQDQPPTAPILRIEPGMHTTRITRIGVDAACSRMVTGSEDKTARLWDISDKTGGAPRLIRTLRPPIGPGNNGKVWAVALAPDASWSAIGWRWTQGKRELGAVYIVDNTTGSLQHRLPVGHRIANLAISPDGALLAATLRGGLGLRVWDTADWSLVTQDAGYSRRSHGATFDRQGRLWTVSYDGHLRRYERQPGGEGLRLPPTKVKTLGGQEPYSVSVHPRQDLVAVGHLDTTAVEVIDAATLKRRFAADTHGIDNGNLMAVAWSADGQRLFAGGRYALIKGGKDLDSPILVWEREGRGSARELPGTSNTIMGLLPCGDAIALGAQDPAFGLVAPDGTRRLWQDTVKPDMRDTLRAHFRIANEAQRVWFSLGNGGKTPVVFDLTKQQLDAPDGREEDLTQASRTGLPVSGWEDTRRPTLDGRPIRLERYEWSRSLAIAPDAQRFVLGTEWRLRAYDRTGNPLWQKAVPGIAWGVNIPKDGRTVVAAYGDGTIRWHRLSDGQELLALFVHAKDKRWVLWTPKGYYTASPNGESLIGWHINQGWEKEAAFFPASLFRGQYYRPDIVRLVLDTLDEDKAIEEANRRANQPTATPITKALPPVAKIIRPATGTTFAGPTVRLAYTVTSPIGEKIVDVDIKVDGRPISSATRAAVPVNSRDNKNVIEVEIPVPPRDVTVSLVAWSGSDIVRRASEAVAIDLKWTGQAPDTSKLPRLFGLFVGVSDYKADRLDLNYAHRDAEALAAALEAQKGLAYREVTARVLTNEKATRQAILLGLEWLRSSAKQDDIAVIKLAGHGVTDATQFFHFLPHDAKPELPPSVHGISKGRLSEMISRTAGKVVVFVDACHAGDGLATPGAGLGPADMTALVNELGSAQVGAIMYAASTGRQLSSEGRQYRGGHGAFTAALLEGLEGKANKYPPPGIDTGELNPWLNYRVKELTGGQQTPTMVKPTALTDFALALVQ